jgi:hypothetical protein
MRSACPISFDLCADAGLLLALFDVRRSTLFCSDRSNSGESAFETALLTGWKSPRHHHSPNEALWNTWTVTTGLILP